MQLEIKQDWEKTKEMLEEGNTIPYPVIVDGGCKTTRAVVFVKKIDKRRWLSVLAIMMTCLAATLFISCLTPEFLDGPDNDITNDVNSEKLNQRTKRDLDFQYENNQNGETTRNNQNGETTRNNQNGETTRNNQNWDTPRNNQNWETTTNNQNWETSKNNQNGETTRNNQNWEMAENSLLDKLYKMITNLKPEPTKEPKKPEQQTHSKPNEPTSVNEAHYDTKLANEADLKKTTQTKKTTQKQMAVPSKKAPVDKAQKEQLQDDIFDDYVIVTKDDYEDERGNEITVLQQDEYVFNASGSEVYQQNTVDIVFEIPIENMFDEPAGSQNEIKTTAGKKSGKKGGDEKGESDFIMVLY